MNQNKIIDHIFKKLIHENYQNEEIINFLTLRYHFNEFNHFLYYLWLLANDKNQTAHPYYKFAIILKDYLWTIIERNQIINLDIDNLIMNQLISHKEWYLININYDNHQWYYFNDHHLILLLDKLEFIETNGTLKIKLDNHFNQKFFNQFIKFIKYQQKTILIFKQQELNHQFKGYFYLKEIALTFDHHQLAYYLILLNEPNENIDFKTTNLNLESYLNNIDNFKQAMIDFEQIDDNQKSLIALQKQKNAFVLMHEIIHYHLMHHEQKLLSKLIHHLYNNQTLLLPLNIFNLIPQYTWLNDLTLLLITNCYDFIYSNIITTDHFNNIFIITDNNDQLIEFYEDNLTMKMINENHYFASTLNKKIFNTFNQQKQLIYLFLKKNNQYLFYGYYKVDKLFFDEQQNPTFLLRKANISDLINNYLLVNEDEITNDYENVFINNINHNILKQYQINLESKPLIINNIKNEKINSLMIKYNWIYQKCIEHIDDLKIINYLTIYNELINRLNEQIKALSKHQFIDLWKQQKLQPRSLLNYLIKHLDNHEQNEINEFLASNNSETDINKLIDKLLNKY